MKSINLITHLFFHLFITFHLNAQTAQLCDITQYEILANKHKKNKQDYNILEQLICISNKINALDEAIYWLSKKENIAIDQDDMSTAKKCLDKTAQRIKNYTENKTTVPYVLGYFEHKRNLTEFYYKIGSYEEAERIADAIEIELAKEKNIRDVDRKTYIYDLCNYRMKINIKAVRIDKINDFYEKTAKNQPIPTKQWYKKLYADYYRTISKYQEALNDFYLKIYPIYKDNKKNSIPLAVAIAECYRELGQENKAIEYLSNARRDDIFKLKDLDLAYGKVYSHFNKPKLASFYLKRALTSNIDTWGYNHHEVAETYNTLGVHYKKYNQLDSASFYFKHGLSALADFEYSKQSQFNIQYFTEKNFPKGFIQKQMFIELLSQEGTLLYEQALTKNVEKQSLLEESLKYFSHSTTLIDKVRQSYVSDYDKQSLLNNSYSIYETAIEVCYQLNKLGDVDHKEQALVFSEKSKSIRLFDAFKNSRALQLGNIPDNILKEERELREGILVLETELNNQKVREKELLNQLTSKKVKFQNFIKQIEKSYPSYYNKKYAPPTISLENIQKKLNKNQSWGEWLWGENKTGLVEYFLGEDVLYIFLVTQNDIQFVKQNIEKKDFSALVEQYLTSINNWKGDDLNDEKKYKNTATQLYKLLLSPIEATINQDKLENIIVIADDVIHQIPFSALKKKADSNFLLKTYCFSYTYSISLSEELNQTNSNQAEILAIAPAFPVPSIVIRGEQLGSSSNNIREVENIKQVINSTKIIKGTEATKESFKNQYEDYSIIHLATHAIANIDNPHLSFISFTQNERDATESAIEQELLNLGEVYGLTLNTEMIVLSACETGTGKIEGREGTLSFNRAFTSAGAKSVLSTLWLTRTENLKQITTNFYKNLATTNTNKAKALQQAKLQFISESGYESPYHWASLIPYGNMRTIPFN